MAYVITVSDGKYSAKFEMDNGESKAGTYVTLTPKAANKVLPFGKLYLSPAEFRKTTRQSK